MMAIVAAEVGAAVVQTTAQNAADRKHRARARVRRIAPEAKEGAEGAEGAAGAVGAVGAEDAAAVIVIGAMDAVAVEAATKAAMAVVAAAVVTRKPYGCVHGKDESDTIFRIGVESNSAGTLANLAPTYLANVLGQ